MKFLVIGCGSIGTRHIDNLISLNQQVIAYDNSNDVLKNLKKKIKYFDKLEMAFSENPDAALICTPNNSHVLYGLECIKKGLHVFIEKPISNNLSNIDNLSKLADEKNRVLMVACNIRYHPAVQYIKNMLDKNAIGDILSVRAQYGHYLPNWRPNKDYRYIYSSNEASGGGIVLDSIHEVDYIRWLFGDVEQVSCFAQKISDLEIDTEDIAEIVLKLQNGVIAQIHVDYLNHLKRRSCEIIGTLGTIVWNSWGKNPEEIDISIYLAKGKKRRLLLKEQLADFNNMYVLEIKDFISAIENQSQPISSVDDGLYALEIALAAKKSALENKVVYLR